MLPPAVRRRLRKPKNIWTMGQLHNCSHYFLLELLSISIIKQLTD